MKIFLNMFFLLIIVVSVEAQPITWQRSYKTYGPVGFEGIYSSVQTPDNGFISVGNTRPNGGGSGSVMMALRVNQFGDTIWLKYYDKFSVAKNIIKTHDNNYLIVDNYSFLVKIDINGDTIWTRKPNLPNYTTIRTYSVKLTSDNGFIVCAESRAAFVPYIFKTDSQGILQWQKEYELIGFGRASDALEFNNNFIVCGYLLQSSSQNLYLMNIDSIGNIIWHKIYGSISGVPYSIIKSGDCIVIGGTGNPKNLQGISAFLTKTDLSGNLIWFKTYDPGNPYYGNCRQLILSNDNSYVFAGSASPDSIEVFNTAARIIKTDTSGNVVFKKLYTLKNGNPTGEFILKTSDNGFMLGGNLFEGLYNIHLIKTDSLGYAPPVKIRQISTIIPNEFILHQNYPNPFNPATKITYDIPKESFVKIRIYDITGREIKVIVNEFKQAGSYTAIFNGSGLSSGVYFYKLEADDFRQVKRMVMVK